MNRTGIVLLVEDNADEVELSLRAFRKHKIADRIVVVRDGAEALEYLFANGRYEGRDPSTAPEVVFLDLKLPRIDGLDVLREIRADARTKTLPVVILTSSNERRDVEACYALGANSFVRKPVDFEQFVDAAEKLGLYWLALNEAP